MVGVAARVVPSFCDPLPRGLLCESGGSIPRSTTVRPVLGTERGVSRETTARLLGCSQHSMGREYRRSNGRSYYYRKSRDADGRVLSTYFGNGPLAHLVEHMDAAARECRAYHGAALEAFAADVDAADAAVRACTASVKTRLDEALLQAGYRYHRGEWRRPRQRAEADDRARPGEASGTE